MEACSAGASWPARDSGTQALAAVPTCSATCTRLTAVDLAQGGLLTRPPHAGDAGATTKASGCAGWAVPRSARFLLPLRAPGPRGFHYYAACEDGSSLKGLGFQTRSLVKEIGS